MVDQPPPILNGDLQVSQDVRFEEREWVIQRAAWVVIALILVAALLGAFGRGLLSNREAQTSSGALKMKWERFGRANTPTDITFILGENASSDGRAELTISNSFLQQYEVQSIEPEPERMIVGGQGTRMVYAADERDPGEVAIVFRLKASKLGRNHGVATIPRTGETINFDQLVYP